MNNKLCSYARNLGIILSEYGKGYYQGSISIALRIETSNLGQSSWLAKKYVSANWSYASECTYGYTSATHLSGNF